MSDLLDYASGRTLSFSLCLAPLYPGIFVSKRLGFVDKPNGRKRHQEPTPLVGGIVIFLAICITNLLFETTSWSLLGWLALVLIIGVLDDIYDVSYRIRLATHFAIVLGIAITEGLLVNNIGSIVGGEVVDFFGPIAVVFTAVGVIGAINVVNMSDGVDGLLGSLILASLFVLFLFGFQLPASEMPVSHGSVVVLMGAMIAFLTLNCRFFGLKRARVFMGDAGSTVLGFYLVYLLIAFSQGSEAVISPVLAGWILGLPLLDGSAVITSRLLDRKTPFHPDRRHLHHLLLDSGRSVNETVLIMVGLHGVMIVTASVGFIVFGSAVDTVLFWGFVGLVVLRVLSESWIGAGNSLKGKAVTPRSVALEAGFAENSGEAKKVAGKDAEVGTVGVYSKSET